MELINQYWDILIVVAFVVALSLVLLFLVFWARKGNKGANLAASMFSFIAPDPLFQKNYQIIQESENQVKADENKSGEPPNP